MNKFGFGLMRLPTSHGIDYKQVKQMTDLFIKQGYNYFDTGYEYHGGKSEIAFRECVAKRYSHDDYRIADKLPVYSLRQASRMQPIFDEQLERCGVDYFDNYLLHSLANRYSKGFKEIDSFGFALEKLDDGLIKHLGVSIHDNAAFLDELLTQHPEIEFVQIQLNYLDWNDSSVEAGKCYDVACKHNTPVIVMEPVKGGRLVNIPNKAEKIMSEYNPDLSSAGWALRFCASLDNVEMVLSGMSNLEQMKDNLNTMNNFKALNDEEINIINEVVNIIKPTINIPCTSCNYCINACPIQIPIPELFQLYNNEKQVDTTQGSYKNEYMKLRDNGIKTASDCIECNQCSRKCPQSLDIPGYMSNVTEEFGY